MSKRGKAAVWGSILSIVCGLIIWHAIYWHSTGMYLEMLNWLQMGRGYITVLYNLGLMLVLGAVLGLLMEKITDLLVYKVREIKHLDREKTNNNR